MDFGQSWQDTVATAVAEAEEGTSLEVRVVVVEDSGHYRDVYIMAGSSTFLLVLLVVLAIPQVVNPWWLPAIVAVPFALGALLPFKVQPVFRLLTSSGRRDAQVRQGARAAFVKEGIHTTHERSGLLVYASRRERSLCLLPDIGLDTVAPRGTWQQLESVGSDHALPRRVLTVVEKAGELGRRLLPLDASGMTVNELDNEVVLGSDA